MPWVQRNEEGHIVAVYNEEYEGLEEVQPLDEELQQFLVDGTGLEPINLEWMQSDLSLSRVLEDLIDMLIEKKVITFTDFPDGAQKKLLERRGFRKEFAYMETLFGDEDGNYNEDMSDYQAGTESDDDSFL